MQTIVEMDIDYERIFVLKVDEDLTAKKVSELLSNVNEELHNYCCSNNLLEEYTETMVLLSR